jgi:hypothetical protein
VRLTLEKFDQCELLRAQAVHGGDVEPLRVKDGKPSFRHPLGVGRDIGVQRNQLTVQNSQE